MICPIKNTQKFYNIGANAQGEDMRDLRIIVTGDTNFTDYNQLKKECMKVIAEETKVLVDDEKLNKERILIVTGDNYGAEKLAKKFADYYGLKTKTFGKQEKWTIGALPMRNIDMVKYLYKTNKWYYTVLVIFTKEHDIDTENTVNWLDKLKYKKIVLSAF